MPLKPGTRVLLVEDNAIVRLSEKTSLERNGIPVSAAGSGEKAVDAVRADSSISLVLMDIDLGPGMDGVEAAQRILDIRELPVVFLTAHSEKEYIQRVKEVSRYGYVLKGSPEPMILEAIETALELFQANTRARRHRAAYERILHNSDEAIVVYDTSGRVRVMNRKAAANLGGVPEDFIGGSIRAFLSTEAAKKGDATFRQVLESGESARLETLVELHGETRWFDIRYQPIHDGAEDGISEVLQMSREITREKEAEQALRSSEEKYRLLAENTLDIIYSLDADLNPTYISPSVQTLLGYSPEYISSRGIFAFIDPEDAGWLAETIRSAVSRKAGRSLAEYRVVTAEGQRRWLENRARLLYDEAGELEAIVGTQRDIDGRKRAEERAQQTAIRHERAERTAHVGHWEMDMATGEAYWSDEFFRICGFEPQSFSPTGEQGISIIHPEDRGRARRQFEQAVDGGEPYDIEKRVVRPNGEVRWVHSRGDMIYDRESGAAGLAGTMVDITERKEMEAALQDALGDEEQLLQELNHRVKNNLSMILSLLELKSDSMGEMDDLSDIKSRVRAILTVHEKLQQTGDVRRVDFATYAEEVARSVISMRPDSAARLENRIEGISLPTKTATILGLIVNELCSNAVKYGSDGTPETPMTLTLAMTRDAGEYTLTVSNTGRPFPAGLDPENAGTLGLQLVSALTGQLEGHLHLQRAPYPVFTIRFPAGE